jgi:hypothetical protein
VVAKQQLQLRNTTAPLLILWAYSSKWHEQHLNTIQIWPSAAGYFLGATMQYINNAPSKG